MDSLKKYQHPRCSVYTLLWQNTHFLIELFIYFHIYFLETVEEVSKRQSMEDLIHEQTTEDLRFPN